MKNGKYFIILFCNKKRNKILYRSNINKHIYEYWRQFKTLEKPRYLKEQVGKQHKKAVFELALVFPMNRWVKDVYVTDSLGRLILGKLEDGNLRIKEIIPYWKEELIYDFQKKKSIRYQEMLDNIMKIDEIGQIFTLNNKLFVQNENEIWVYGNKTINDASRLFELVREDLLKSKKGNFIFVKDVTTIQRKNIYNILEARGFKRTELFRHYSY